jgi:hypothetical protein
MSRERHVERNHSRIRVSTLQQFHPRARGGLRADCVYVFAVSLNEERKGGRKTRSCTESRVIFGSCEKLEIILKNRNFKKYCCYDFSWALVIFYIILYNIYYLRSYRHLIILNKEYINCMPVVTIC